MCQEHALFRYGQSFRETAGLHKFEIASNIPPYAIFRRRRPVSRLLTRFIDQLGTVPIHPILRFIKFLRVTGTGGDRNNVAIGKGQMKRICDTEIDTQCPHQVVFDCNGATDRQIGRVRPTADY